MYSNNHSMDFTLMLTKLVRSSECLPVAVTHGVWTAESCGMMLRLFVAAEVTNAGEGFVAVGTRAYVAIAIHPDFRSS